MNWISQDYVIVGRETRVLDYVIWCLIYVIPFKTKNGQDAEQKYQTGVSS